MKIALCTTNRGKAREIKEFLSGLPVEILSLRDIAFEENIIEDGATFHENALKKASTVYEKTGLPSLADDSGLCVDALNGAPGVISAFYAGEPPDYEDNNRRLLGEMKGITDRRARFVCNIVFIFPASLSIFRGKDSRRGKDSAPTASVGNRGFDLRIAANRAIFSCEGVTEGLITDGPRGDQGFGYDPLFFYTPLNKTFGEMRLAEKNSVSHRGKAIETFKKFLINS
ncbi:MAG: non-canonical purine NTP pyrophosphatase [Deltaproteobacteria bacterium]|nr:non-canonical purine NTP pyrophosphatase [Deltaproteobacteria bacterium]